MRLLFVCTGNTCRSPMASALAQSRLSGLDEVWVQSAGLLSGGKPATPEAIEVMARRGLDLGGHLSRSLEEALGSSPTPDLIVGMAREHARVAVELEPKLFSRTFTLKELARRTEMTGPRREDESLESYLRQLGEERKVWHLAGFSSRDDVADPIGKGPKAYERCATEIDDLVSKVVRYLWPDRATRSDKVVKKY